MTRISTFGDFLYYLNDFFFSNQTYIILNWLCACKIQIPNWRPSWPQSDIDCHKIDSDAGNQLSELAHADSRGLSGHLLKVVFAWQLAKKLPHITLYKGTAQNYISNGWEAPWDWLVPCLKSRLYHGGLHKRDSWATGHCNKMDERLSPDQERPFRWVVSGQISMGVFSMVIPTGVKKGLLGWRGLGPLPACSLR